MNHVHNNVTKKIDNWYKLLDVKKAYSDRKTSLYKNPF